MIYTTFMMRDPFRYSAFMMITFSECSVTEWTMPRLPAGLNCAFIIDMHKAELGAQWLSGRVLDSRPKGRGFEPHRRHCVVVLEQDTFTTA